jgi:hypothetical protein
MSHEEQEERLFPWSDIKFFWLVAPPFAVILTMYNAVEDYRAKKQPAQPIARKLSASQV